MNKEPLISPQVFNYLHDLDIEPRTRLNGLALKRHHLAGALSGLTLLIPGAACASDLFDEAWELRLAISMDRQSNYPSTLGRHASVAFPGGASKNPASDDWHKQPSPSTGSAALIESPSESGALVQAVIGAVSFQPQAMPGTWSLAFARTDTLDSTALQGFNNEVESNEFFVGYSRRLSDRLAWGMQVRLLDADLMRESAIAELGGLPGRVETALKGADVEFGLLGDLGSGWTWGAVAGLGLLDADSDLSNLTPIPLPVPPFLLPPGTPLGSSDEDILTTLVRLGVGKSWQGGGAYADVHYIHLGTDYLGSVELARLSIGVEQMVRPEWIVRGGFTTDTIQEWSWGAGVSYTGIQGSMIEFGYQYNAAPEMKPELGRFQLFSASVAWAL